MRTVELLKVNWSKEAKILNVCFGICKIRYYFRDEKLSFKKEIDLCQQKFFWPTIYFPL